ncbi:hypothetical protein BIFANG_03783 [Bifidobacterium angulatum DSM 20098 = JCM 7096]|uniref:Uncharacterized protein n=1 Tax=Bifidobacterium angulatum DSM 20098 = JCM 7096 TaxID=518635 RepID=C4FHE7_9BIFI|nr:hypothetical protein BIFANG_03783 [Bifidobacterium angulatum DSM 20098 = JCM 7096]BAQ95965.1 hypothetical protein BBAG_0343 [Bifidobacterium angulatum DSM 20098 = JCM 7096]
MCLRATWNFNNGGTGIPVVNCGKPNDMKSFLPPCNRVSAITDKPS